MNDKVMQFIVLCKHVASHRIRRNCPHSVDLEPLKISMRKHVTLQYMHCDAVTATLVTHACLVDQVIADKDNIFSLARGR